MSKEESQPSNLARYPDTRHLVVGTETIQLVAENVKRKGLLVYNNTSGAVIYILSSKAKAAADGIPVAYQQSYSNDTCYGALWIVSDTASTDVRVEEDTD